MTILNVDVKGLEVVTAAWLSQDKVLYKELNDGADIHQANQDAFGLPSRLVAKVLKFRLLYGGTEYSFAQDPDFTPVSSSVKYWKKVIEKYYDKYSGIKKWHDSLLTQVAKSGTMVTPFGRQFKFDCHKYGEFKLPATQIKNFPVQGTGADIVAMARCSVFRRWKEQGIEGKLVNTVHDSIVCDIPSREKEHVVKMFTDVFEDLPGQISRIFDVNFDLKVNVEITVGQDQYNLVSV